MKFARFFRKFALDKPEYRSIMRHLLCALLMFLALTVYATGQEGDVIYINGERLDLLGKPICLDSTLYHTLKDELPSNRPIVTSNWDGFTAYWSINNDKLYLDSVRCEAYDPKAKAVTGESIPSMTLYRIFNRYCAGNRIAASWVSGKIRVAKGKVIYYQHSGFERNYEEETILDIDKGKVIGKKEYHNFVKDGFAFDKLQENGAQEMLHKILPLHIERYPELVNVKRLIFSVKRARVDEKGNLLECNVQVVRPDAGPQLATEIAEALKNYHPWKVYYINGEYRALGIENWSIPYILHDK